MGKKREEFVIIGLGRFGSSLALELSSLGCTVLAIDRNRRLVQELSTELPDTAVLDATDEEALQAAGVSEFDTAVVAIGSDFESNVLITSILKDLRIRRLICKAVTQRQRRILLRMGADMVVLPEHEAGMRLARLMLDPRLPMDSLELGPGLSFGRILCHRSWVGAALKDAGLRQDHGVVVLWIQGARSIVMPGPDEVLEAGDELVIVGAEENVRRLLDGNG